MKTGEKLSLCLLLLIAFAGSVAAQELITNVYGRNIHSLNGKWNAIIDLYDQGQRMKIYENRQPEGNIDFYEYAFEGGLRLNVPGDWNSQSPELKYYEGTVWYARHFDAKRLADKRQFLYFGAVSYRSKVYLNGKEIAEHEGGFTPFQVEVTDLLKDGDNFLAVEVNNRRTKDAIPAMAFDWWNYGGITRDVLLVKTPRTFIKDYFIQLDKNTPDRIIARVRLSDKKAGEKVTVAIPELKINAELTTDAEGKAETVLNAKRLQRWSPEEPKLYGVTVSSSADRVEEQIGFRNITVKGTDIYLNGKPTFMCCISFHEEIPQRMVMSHIFLNNTLVLSKYFNKRENIRHQWRNYFKPGYPPLYFCYNFLELAFPLFSGFYTVHGTSPLCRSTYETLWEKEYSLLDATCLHKFRHADDVNQYLLREWQKLTGYFTAENVCRSFRYFNASSDNKKLVSVIKKQKADIICINDANTAIDFERAKTQISTAFSALFPEPSSFEKGQ